MCEQDYVTAKISTYCFVKTHSKENFVFGVFKQIFVAFFL